MVGVQAAKLLDGTQKETDLLYIYMSNGVGLYRKMLSDSWTQWEHYCSYLYIIISNIKLGPDKDRKRE